MNSAKTTKRATTLSRRWAGSMLLATLVVGTQAWIAPQPYRRLHSPLTIRMAGDDQGPFSFFTNPYESNIPPELRDEIYAAEANTPAAQERGARVATYALFAFVGIVLAFFSAFITELRNTPLPPGETGDPLTIAGFDWVRGNPITSFLFTNKIGGGICLLGGAGAGLLAEAELDTKRINAEKIFTEMERRREKKGKKQQPKKGKKRRSGKERKRMEALSEIVEAEPKQVVVAEENDSSVAEDRTEPESPSDKVTDEKEQEDGILGKIKGFYDKADSMANAQALLLNKELEDRGVVEKITDETGLKVIGKDAASKLQSEKQQESESKAKESNN